MLGSSLPWLPFSQQGRYANFCSHPSSDQIVLAARGTLGHQSAADVPALEQARRAAASTHAMTAQAGAAATTAQQALAAADLASKLQDSNEQKAPTTVFVSTGQSSKKFPPKHQQQIMTRCRAAPADHTQQACAVVSTKPAVKKKSNQLRRQASIPQESSAQAASDLAGKFVGFQS